MRRLTIRDYVIIHLDRQMGIIIWVERFILMQLLWIWTFDLRIPRKNQSFLSAVVGWVQCENISLNSSDFRMGRVSSKPPFYLTPWSIFAVFSEWAASEFSTNQRSKNGIKNLIRLRNGHGLLHEYLFRFQVRGPKLWLRFSGWPPSPFIRLSFFQKQKPLILKFQKTETERNDAQLFVLASRSYCHHLNWRRSRQLRDTQGNG